MEVYPNEQLQKKKNPIKNYNLHLDPVLHLATMCIKQTINNYTKQNQIASGIVFSRFVHALFNIRFK